ncbi:MAG: hypothetical protein IBX62_06745 [Coriobacteriia bacterium]|nr:hypothetical protein [Coriobacteriia bacterium]
MTPLARTAAPAAALAAVALACALAAPAPAYAHVPVLEPSRSSDEVGRPSEPYPGAVGVRAPEVSLAVYGYLAEDELFDVYDFTPSEPVSTHVSILVPAEEDLGRFRPVVTVERATGTGARLVAEAASPPRRETFFEPFTLQTLYRGEEATVTLEAGQRYYLRVSPGSGGRRTGPYVVAFSGPERFGAGDAVRTLVRVPRIVLGLYGQAAFDPVPLLVLGAVLAIGAGILIAIRRRAGSRSR